MSQQQRTVRLNDGPTEPEDQLWATGDVTIVGPGTSARTAAGQTVAQALRAASLPTPTVEQTVRVNLEEVRDFSRVLQQGDCVTITNRVRGGARGSGATLGL